MTDKQIRDEAMTLFLAGHETTANALAFTWYLLTKHKAIYDRMKEEIDSVLGSRAPTYADIDHLPYTLQILKESIRLYSPVYLISRQATLPVTIAGIQFPAGSRLLVSPYILHRRSDAFPNPEQFIPDRFSEVGERQLPRMAYLPFGAGPHGCIGYRLALMEAHLVLATLAQRVVFEQLPNQQLQPEPLISLRAGTVKMRVHYRDSPTQRASDVSQRDTTNLGRYTGPTT